jgi:SAM-dependent methyltransferase
MDSGSFPPNLSLEIDDITLGLRHFAGQIDLVHMRCVSGGIHDIDKTLWELQQCLKPGGLLIVVDGDPSILSEDRKTIFPFIRLPGDGGPEVTGVSEQGSWFRRFLWGR